MIVTVHQPDHLPYLGFYYKMMQADVFVIYDTAQYGKGKTHNRQRIRTNTGWTWLTIPIENSLSSFLETRISYQSKKPWNEEHWRTIEMIYGKTPYFNQYYEKLKRLYLSYSPKTLAECNVPRLLFLKEAFGLTQEVVFMSDYDIPEDASPSEKLALITEELGGDTYLSGPSGKKYMEYSPFEERGIKVAFSEFHHPEYPQYHSRFDNKFEPNMASIDILFNIGKLPLIVSSPPAPLVSQSAQNT